VRSGELTVDQTRQADRVELEAFRPVIREEVEPAVLGREPSGEFGHEAGDLAIRVRSFELGCERAQACQVRLPSDLFIGVR